MIISRVDDSDSEVDIETAPSDATEVSSMCSTHVKPAITEDNAISLLSPSGLDDSHYLLPSSAEEKCLVINNIPVPEKIGTSRVGISRYLSVDPNMVTGLHCRPIREDYCEVVCSSDSLGDIEASSNCRVEVSDCDKDTVEEEIVTASILNELVTQATNIGCEVLHGGVEQERQVGPSLSGFSDTCSASEILASSDMHLEHQNQSMLDTCINDHELAEHSRKEVAKANTEPVKAVSVIFTPKTCSVEKQNHVTDNAIPMKQNLINHGILNSNVKPLTESCAHAEPNRITYVNKDAASLSFDALLKNTLSKNLVLDSKRCTPLPSNPCEADAKFASGQNIIKPLDQCQIDVSSQSFLFQNSTSEHFIQASSSAWCEINSTTENVAPLQTDVSSNGCDTFSEASKDVSTTSVGLADDGQLSFSVTSTITCPQIFYSCGSRSSEYSKNDVIQTKPLTAENCQNSTVVISTSRPHRELKENVIGDCSLANSSFSATTCIPSIDHEEVYNKMVSVNLPYSSKIAEGNEENLLNNVSDFENDVEDAVRESCETVKVKTSEDEASATVDNLCTQEQPTPTDEVFLGRETILESERGACFEFFQGKGSKTPDRYLKIRNFILDQW